MKKINFDGIRERNDYQIDYYLGGINMEFIKKGKNYMIKNSNGRIVSEEEKLKLEKNELVLEDVKSNKCQEKTTKKIKEIDEELQKKGGRPKRGKAVPITEEVKENETDSSVITETV